MSKAKGMRVFLILVFEFDKGGEVVCSAVYLRFWELFWVFV